MGKYHSKLLSSEEIAQSTLAFDFEKPDGFTFTPGQSINLFLPENFPGVSDDRQRAFSLVSAPHEDRLTIATRMRKSAYKQPLKNAAPGAAVLIVGPTGSMALHDDPDRAIVMIAGGIGITPFISMLRSPNSRAFALAASPAIAARGDFMPRASPSSRSRSNSTPPRAWGG